MNTREIDNILNQYLSKFEVSVKAGTDFAYWYAEDVIEYAFVVSERMNNLFLNFAKSQGLRYNVDIFLLSLYHELGHHLSYEDLDDVDVNYSLDVKASLTDSDADCDIYFNLPDEIAATNWAIDYINENPEEIAGLWNQLQPAIARFYKQNNIY